MMYRVLITGLLYAAADSSDNLKSLQNTLQKQASTLDDQEKTKASTNQQQGQQQTEQHEHKQSTEARKYVDEYVPQAYRKYALKKDKAAKDQKQDTADSQKKQVDNGAVNLLEKTHASKQQSSGDYQQYMDKYAGGSQGGSQSQSGDYQQYMKKYAGGSQSGDYQQYMKKYAGGSQGGSQSQSQGDYQQYMKKYASNYEQYFGKYVHQNHAASKKQQAGDDAVNLLEAPKSSSDKDQKSQSQAGNYQQYMKKYAGGSQSGNYQQYMKKYAGGSQGGSQSQSGNYQQYMKKYAGGSQGGSQSQSGDYQQYMKKYAGGSQGGSQSQSGDYQQYMKKYAGGSQGGNYQQYMKKYAGGAKGSDATTELLQLPSDKSSGASSADSAADSNKDYEQYMKKYAGGNQGGNFKQYYENYMSKYAGGDNSYMKYADYQTYIKRYSHENNNDNVVGSAHDAQNVSQLDAWRSQALQNNKWYVPADYSKYANQNVDRQYKERRIELKHAAETSLSAQTPLSDDDTELASILNLAAVPEKKAESVDHLREAAEAEVKKAETLGESLKSHADDSDAIELAAARPGNNVEAAYSKRAKALEDDITNLQEQVKSKSTSADFADQLQQVREKAKHLRNDELRALDQAHRDANEAASHAAQGSQTEVRHEARRVWALSDRMARANETYEDLSNKLQNRVEAAADRAESNSDELARRTQDRLQRHLENAKKSVRQESEKRLDTLREVRGQFEELETAQKSTQSDAYEFLAQSVRSGNMYDSAPVAFAALCGVALAFLAFSYKRNSCISDPDRLYQLMV